MKKLLFFILLFIAAKGFGQSGVVPIRGDSLNVGTKTHPMELNLRNRTQDSAGGLLTNMGGGRTSFELPQQINDSTIKIGPLTIIIGNGVSNSDTIYIFSGVDTFDVRRPGVGTGAIYLVYTSGGDLIVPNWAPGNGMGFAVQPDSLVIVNWGGTLSQNTTVTGAGFYTAFAGGRLEAGQGAAVTAANDMTVGNDGNLFSVTGNTQINAITTTNWQGGSKISLVFTGTPTLKHNTAGGAGTAKLLLSGGVDYVAAAGDYIGLEYETGVGWHETARKIAASGGSGVYTFTNGLTESPAGTVGLRGTLTRSDTIFTTTAFQLVVSGDVPTGGIAGTFMVINGDATGRAIRANAIGSGAIGFEANAQNGFGVYSTATTGTAVRGNTTSGVALYGSTVTGIPITAIQVNNADNSTVLPMLDILRLATFGGGGTDGIGGSIRFSVQTTSLGQTTNEIKSIWTTATSASRVSQMIITGVDNAVLQNLLTLNGNGTLKADQVANWGDFANNAAAITGGLSAGDFYRNGDVVQIVH